MLHAEGPQSHQGQHCGQAELGAHPASSSVTSSIHWGPARAGTWLCSGLSLLGPRTLHLAWRIWCEESGPPWRLRAWLRGPWSLLWVMPLSPQPPAGSACPAPWKREVQVDPNFMCGSEPAGKSPCGLKSFQPFNRPRNSSKTSHTSPKEARRAGGQKPPPSSPLTLAYNSSSVEG